MKYLLYCLLFANKALRAIDLPTGVNGCSVYVIERNDLAAVVSEVTRTELSRDISTIVAYHNVIESFHRRHAIVPLRFGALMDDRADIERLLENNDKRYKMSLKELAGCEEMGIKVILDDLDAEIEAQDPALHLSFSGSSGPGAAFLSSRKAHYAKESLVTEKHQKAMARYRAPFEGLFVNFNGEVSKSSVNGSQTNCTFLSLNFLVPRESLMAFRNAFAQLRSAETARMMLSGPWPPYNFVLPQDCRTEITVQSRT